MPLKPKPFGIAVDWYRYFLARSPSFDGTDVTAAEFELLVNQSVELFGPIFSANDRDVQNVGAAPVDCGVLYRLSECALVSANAFWTTELDTIGRRASSPEVRN